MKLTDVPPIPRSVEDRVKKALDGITDMRSAMKTVIVAMWAEGFVAGHESTLKEKSE